MPFVQRENGNIIGIFANRQPGFAEEWLDDDAPDVAAFLASIAPKKTVIFKADIWRRASDAEAQVIDLQLSAQPIRLQRMWQDSQTLSVDDQLYPRIRDAFVVAFGDVRAAQLLEPTA